VSGGNLKAEEKGVLSLFFSTEEGEHQHIPVSDGRGKERSKPLTESSTDEMNYRARKRKGDYSRGKKKEKKKKKKNPTKK